MINKCQINSGLASIVTLFMMNDVSCGVSVLLVTDNQCFVRRKVDKTNVCMLFGLGEMLYFFEICIILRASGG